MTVTVEKYDKELFRLKKAKSIFKICVICIRRYE